MTGVHEETLMRITAQFVAACEAGQQPRLDDYVQRYPQFAGELADFVAYYYALETDLPEGTAPALSAFSRAALDRAWTRAETRPAGKAATLLMLASRRGYSLAHLAVALDLSADIVEQLFQHQFDPATIPQELLQRLAHLLARSVETVRETLGIQERQRRLSVAEEPGSYTLSPQPSFRQALLASSQLSAAQKEYWLAALERQKSSSEN